MDDAYQSFYNAAKQKLLRHDGDQIVRRHVNATSGVKTERGWKIRKLRPGGKGKKKGSSQQIDATIAMVMAVARARYKAGESNYSNWLI